MNYLVFRRFRIYGIALNDVKFNFCWFNQLICNVCSFITAKKELEVAFIKNKILFWFIRVYYDYLSIFSS